MPNPPFDDDESPLGDAEESSGRRLHAVPDESFDTPVDPASAHRQRLPEQTRPGWLPRPVLVALLVVGVEVVTLMLGMAFLVSTLLQDAQTDTGLTLATITFSLLMALGLSLGGFALLRGRRWGRAPLVTWQVLQVLVIYPALQMPARPIAALMLVLSAIGLIALLSPATSRHLATRQ